MTNHKENWGPVFEILARSVSGRGEKLPIIDSCSGHYYHREQFWTRKNTFSNARFEKAIIWKFFPLASTSSGAEKKSPPHKMCGVQNDGDNFLKLFIKEFAHLGLILAHFDFGPLT